MGRINYELLLLLIFGQFIVVPLALAEKPLVAESLSLDCAKPLESGPSAVKQAIGPLFANGADKPKLQTAAHQLDQFVTDAIYCRVVLQSGAQPATKETMNEWFSLHQWLNRLADTFTNSASQVDDTRWRDEYTLFAEIYEFEP